MNTRETIEVRDAVRVTSSINSFDGDLEKWKDAFYQVWRFQLTWGFAYQIELNETRSGVYISMLIKPAYQDNLLAVMDDLGYRDIRTYHENLGQIEYASPEFLDQYIDVIVVE